MVSASLGSLDGYEAVENTYTFTGKTQDCEACSDQQ
ncbi:Uncharacterised protein [Bacteroides intestinalis]|uniref:Uncharacterized protein n=1 Tax=Bacteroides intestinalis TaxID=329854 RepID=A0A6N2W8X7_9BACE